MERKVVTRFAPSPTGFMHVGGVRTALYAWLWARKNNGTFILRIEDTDKDREVAGSIDHIMASLTWLGLNWDEGPDIGGPNTPYLQSERLDHYKKYAQTLIDKGFAYADPYTEEEVEAFRQQSITDHKPFLYREHRPENPPVWDGTQPLRFKITDVKTYVWHDLVRGSLSAGPEALDDFILIKGDGYPTYNFAHIIDDLEMGVTHIMRADEFISSTPKFLALYDALGIERPEIATLPPIMGPDGKKKLGKRDGAKDILEYRTEGYLPEAMINFLALLGWNPGTEKEIFTREELIEAFDISRVHKAGAKMNQEKLDWINKEHLKNLSGGSLEKSLLDFVPESFKTAPYYSEERMKKLIPILVERIEKFSDLTKMIEAGELTFFFTRPALVREKLIWKGDNGSQTLLCLSHVRELLAGLEEKHFDVNLIKETIMHYADTLESRGLALHPTRFALSGLDKSPDPFIIASILGKEETLARLDSAIEILTQK